MAGRYKPYPDYKDSGVEWLGEIPKSWEIKKLKYICSVGTGTKDTVNAVEDGLYPFFVRSQTIERINSFGADCEAVLTAGDGVGVGKVFHYYNGKFDYHQRVYMLNNFNLALGKFVYYYLSNNFYKVALEGNAKSTVDSLRMPQFLNFEFSLPEQELQEKIVLFLDHETGKIDTLVEKQEQLIQLLKEKRQALISHAVTKGLNPTAKMRDSGAEWFGQVPEQWDVCLIKYRCEEITDGAHVSPVTEGGERYFISTKDIKNGVINFNHALLTTPASFDYMVKTGCLPFAGDILFSKDGTIGQTAIAPEGVEFVVASSLIIIRPDRRRVISQYFDFLLQSDAVAEQVKSLVKGAGLPRLSIQNLLKIGGAFPPIQEQVEIVAYLSSKLVRYDELESRASLKVKLLQERRAALICAAVTGKIDVRTWVAPQVGQIDKEVAA
ncbi:restriction endonuclease subunit S [Pseudomonas sp. BIC9C]|uniref:restriction endonuclease subunit S n=1 Tax=Pseudomonas sp. BIC9C TaxID=3078458 RepID=UPI002AD3F922|nr:restriction endonuclease subunit S [Pseudomonas sp. BIC9C]